MEAATEVGVHLSRGYNDDITARQAGSVGGRTVRNAHTARLLKNVQFMRGNRVGSGRKAVVKYMVGAAV